MGEQRTGTCGEGGKERCATAGTATTARKRRAMRRRDEDEDEECPQCGADKTRDSLDRDRRQETRRGGRLRNEKWSATATAAWMGSDTGTGTRSLDSNHVTGPAGYKVAR